jgi:RimJ/RimL family protein N-acetyltransferase
MSIVPYKHPGLDRQDEYPPLITGARIELRLITEPSDAPLGATHIAAELFALIDRNRAHLATFDWLPAISGAADVYRELVENKAVFYGIYVADTLVGAVSVSEDGCRICYSDDELPCCIEYWLDAAATGNGYISEALPLLERLLFTRGYNIIELQCAARNVASQRVATRADYVKFGECDYWIEADNSTVRVYEYMKEKRNYCR